jgi:hypothetical protein
VYPADLHGRILREDDIPAAGDEMPVDRQTRAIRTHGIAERSRPLRDVRALSESDTRPSEPMAQQIA